MKLTPLEADVIRCLLADPNINLERTVLDFDAVTVGSRELSGVGFLTELARAEELKLFDDNVSLRWGNVVARLNTSRAMALGRFGKAAALTIGSRAVLVPS
jgi:hypothetical protein